MTSAEVGLISTFLSTPSARRATDAVHDAEHHRDNFYPRPPRGGRRSACGALRNCGGFLSTPSARRATVWLPFAFPPFFISIHALREEGDHDLFHSPGFVYEFLSTPSARRATFDAGACNQDQGYFYPRPPRGGRHALAEHDFVAGFISIHALREEGDSTVHGCCRGELTFLSTPSARRATWCHKINPTLFRISIHALREEGDG